MIETTISKSVEWETPPDFIAPLKQAFTFTLDVCAARPNICDRYYDRETDGLAQDWAGEVFWMNPPYGRAGNISAWLQKAYLSATQPWTLGVVLAPARTSTIWFHKYIAKAQLVCFVKGRITFVDGPTGKTLSPAQFPNCLAVFGNKRLITTRQIETLRGYGWLAAGGDL